MPLVYYVSELEKNVTLDAERLLRLLGVSGKLSGFYFAVYMLEQVQEKPEYVLLQPDHSLLDHIAGCPLSQPPTNSQFIDMLAAYLRNGT